MTNARFAFLVGMILAAAASRLIPHPPNFTPIAAMALFIYLMRVARAAISRQEQAPRDAALRPAPA